MSALRAALLAAMVAAPLAAQSATGAGATIPVAARTMLRGHVLAADDVRERPAAPGERPPFPRRPGIGWIARRPIAEGEVLREPALTPPLAVLPGDTVFAVATRDGITLALRATALQGAALGDRVAVRVDTRRRYEGTLVSPRQVVLP